MSKVIRGVLEARGKLGDDRTHKGNGGLPRVVAGANPSIYLSLCLPIYLCVWFIYSNGKRRATAAPSRYKFINTFIDMSLTTL